jgi:hypothetical protein
MSLEDRAGNRAELNGTFEVETSDDEWELESINCIHGDGKVEAVEVLRSIPYPLKTAVHAIAFDCDLSPVILPMELASLEGRPMDEDVFNASRSKPRIPASAWNAWKGRPRPLLRDLG